MIGYLLFRIFHKSIYRILHSLCQVGFSPLSLSPLTILFLAVFILELIFNQGGLYSHQEIPLILVPKLLIRSSN